MPHRLPRLPGLLTTLTLFAGVAASGPTSSVMSADPASLTAPALRTVAHQNEPHIVSREWITERTMRLTVATSSFSTGTAPVEVTLPRGHAEQPDRHWPVTYYLAGTNGDETWFRTAYRGEELTDDFPAIVVSPEGNAGYWSDWFNQGSFGPPRYETFVTRELIPLIDQTFRTLPRRSQRAVMGESMGGYGALMMGARHPDQFASAVSIMGAVDTNFPTGALAHSISPLIDLAPPDSIYGPRATQEVRWRGHNPLDLAPNLRGVAVQIRTGNGVLDPAREQDPATPAFCAVEAGVIQPESANLHRRMTQLGIEHTWREYDWGCHSPAAAQQQISDSLPGILRTFENPAPRPSFDYRSIQPRFDIGGWRFGTDPLRALEFLDLHGVGRSGLALTGSGSTTVRTPAYFRPGSTVIVEVGDTRRAVTADPQGRLQFTVRLGAPHHAQQFTPGADQPMVTKRVVFHT